MPEDATSQRLAAIDRLGIFNEGTINATEAKIVFKNAVEAALKALTPDSTWKTVTHTVRDPNTGEWRDVYQTVQVLGAPKTGFDENTAIGRTNTLNLIAMVDAAKNVLALDIVMGKSPRETLADWDANRAEIVKTVNTMRNYKDASAEALVKQFAPQTDIEIRGAIASPE
jgi:hypothetical protein